MIKRKGSGFNERVRKIQSSSFVKDETLLSLTGVLHRISEIELAVPSLPSLAAEP